MTTIYVGTVPSIEVQGHPEGSVTIRFRRGSCTGHLEDVIADSLAMAAAALEVAPIRNLVEGNAQRDNVRVLREVADALDAACIDADELAAAAAKEAKRQARADERARRKRDSGQEALV